ncbi:MAG: AAA family ATPase [Bacteroidales bacterium]|nr:AAA family ATPase [Bacteroidales bacterium]
MPPADSPQTPVLLPPHIAPSEDLSWRARGLGGDTAPSPFSHPAYAIVFDGVARALHRHQLPHALLVGERGVGKSAIAAELAKRAARGDLRFLTPKRFLAIDARYIPLDESRARLAAILSHITPHPDLVVVLDGLAGLLGASLGNANKTVLMGSLVHARCHLLGLLTPWEYDELAGDDPDFAELFTRVDVLEPDRDAARPLLVHYARGLADRYQLRVEPEAIECALTLTSDYILNDQLPAKAVKVITSACEAADYDRRQLGHAREQISTDDVLRAVAERTGVPADTLRGVAKHTDYAEALRSVVFGQDQAIQEVATELGLIQAGMTDPTKPASVLMFLGQTGTGKTELAKALARFYSGSKRLKTYTLGNCVEPHSVATVIGVPPGYVGSERGGRLVNELNADPYGVFLLDEADKAHPDVLQPFLNLFDEGWVVDQRGARGYGRHAIFVLTSNVGQRMIADMHKEGKSTEEITLRMKEALSQIRHGKSDRPVFTPEFLARIKRVIVFRPLDGAATTAIATRQSEELIRSWSGGRGKSLQIARDLIEYLGAAAHRLDTRSGGKEGGRVVRKLMADWIEAPLQRAMATDPDKYRRAQTIQLQFQRPADPAENAVYSPAEVTVHWE